MDHNCHSGRSRWAYKPKSKRGPRVSTFAYKLAHGRSKRIIKGRSVSGRSKTVKRNVVNVGSKENPKLELMATCPYSFNKKYQTRPSPPYPANECCGFTKRGNDGNMYKSVSDKNGVCTWRPI